MKQSEKQKQWKHEDYINKKQYYQKRDKLRREKFRFIVRKAKDVPCSKCGLRFHFSAMDFHHRDKNEKLFEIGDIRLFSSEKKLLEELAKCDVLCSNCHRVITWMEITGEVI